MEQAARRARDAAQKLAGASGELKDQALRAVKAKLVERRAVIEEANAADKKDAAAAVAAGTMSQALEKRLDVSGAKFDGLLRGIDDVLALPDPIGQVSYAVELDDNLELYRLSCPIGVLAIIFEARPDAAVQIGALALKSGNALLLKGGKEALKSNKAIIEAIEAGIASVPGMPECCIQSVDTRSDVAELLKMDKFVDLVIPRGGNELVQHVQKNTTIPVLGHADGICAVYVDEDADLQKAVRICADSKCQYPAACNAMETLLVHEKMVSKFLPKFADEMAKKDPKYKADSTCIACLPTSNAEPSTEEDYHTEFLSIRMAVKAVPSLDAAIQHINGHSSHHTDVIVTESSENAAKFLRDVDSAGVFHNASSRFADGFRYGFGAEVGISTNRIHARGPVGLEGLVIYKYHLYGKGQTVSDFSGNLSFKHRKLSGITSEEGIRQRHPLNTANGKLNFEPASRLPNAANPDSVQSIRGLDLPTFDGSNLRIGIISARWNSVVCEALTKGCMDAMKHCKVNDITVEYVAGSYEIPAAAQVLLETGSFDGVVCIGCLVKGETMHFEYICEAVSQGIMRLNLDYKTPVIYGILSVLNEEQAKARAGLEGKGHNSGIDWGITAVESCLLKKKYQGAKKGLRFD